LISPPDAGMRGIDVVVWISTPNDQNAFSTWFSHR